MDISLSTMSAADALMDTPSRKFCEARAEAEQLN